MKKEPTKRRKSNVEQGKRYEEKRAAKLKEGGKPI